MVGLDAVAPTTLAATAADAAIMLLLLGVLACGKKPFEAVELEDEGVVVVVGVVVLLKLAGRGGGRGG